ncbi:M48 family metallopeptidase [Plantibacter sp. VKM Ac-2885]|uniref:M48 family metallopeptidase n=1 Tax=Plantibacter sp. VKM Ac-2885 TaxID=2783828 RepID=UPI00188A477A|nr:M48 family metallopeptidase [Plantibacter sp. VKM Ac-2885]MBF4512458.1 M48 family metallopeptidase [Plantibacter sp. VKM Ac-2885]
MYRAIARNKLNTALIFVVFLVIIGGLGWLAGYLYQNLTITIVVLVVAVVYAVIQYFFAGRQAIAMTGAQRIELADNPRLYRIVENLAITTGTPMPEVYLIADPAPNAFATGRDPQHAMVAATTGLLEILNDAELEGVMAHELGHVRNYDIRVSMVVFGLVVAIGFLSDMLLRMTIWGGGNRNNNNGGNPVMLIIGIVAMLVAPLLATLVQLSISRQREYLADATGALTTRHPEALASALGKLAAYGRPMAKQNSSMAHLWISDPLKPGVVARLFSTHPPLVERIKRLSTIGGGF